MRIPFTAVREREFAILDLSAADAARMAQLHREDFVRPWTDGEFADMLSQNTVFGFAALETGKGSAGPVGFVLARLAADEGEILTIAVSRNHRRLGLGWKLMNAVLRQLHGARAKSLFLEVDEGNAGAIALYRRLGFSQVGKRPAYYADADGKRSAALVMKRDLG